MVAGGGLRLRRKAGDDAAEDLEGVSLGVVAENVMVRDQLATGGRYFADLGTDPGVELVQSRLITAGALLIEGGVLRVCFTKGCADVLDHHARVRDREPDMRVAGRCAVIPVARSAALYTLAHADNLATATLDRLVDEGVEAEAVAQDKVGIAQGADLARRRREVVRVLVGPEQHRQAHTIAGYGLDEVADLGRRRDDAQTRRVLVRCATGERERESERSPHRRQHPWP